MTSARLFNAWLPLQCKATCMRSLYQYKVWLPTWCLTTGKVSSYLYDVGLPVLSLATCIISAQLPDVCIREEVWSTVGVLFCIAIIFFPCLCFDERNSHAFLSRETKFHMPCGSLNLIHNDILHVLFRETTTQFSNVMYLAKYKICR
jgi:hypothetical protein